MSGREWSEMARVLRRSGHRATKPRLAVMQVLDQNDAGLSPEEIHRQGRALCAHLGLVTVYRTLELLDDLGVVRRVHGEDRCHRYAVAGPDKHYLVCNRCRRVLEFPCGGLEALIGGVGLESGYLITDHLLELRGLCPECQEAGTMPVAGEEPTPG